jgi:hypothetical protein
MKEEAEPFLEVAETAYRNGHYTKACDKFIQARKINGFNVSSYMADIFHRDLCNHKHSQNAVAELYLEVALAGDADVYSYLMTINEDVFMKPRREAIIIIVKHWEENNKKIND